jgi:hypothetical protein
VAKRADIKAFAINAASRKTVIFALQMSKKHLALLIAFRQETVSNRSATSCKPSGCEKTQFYFL